MLLAIRDFINAVSNLKSLMPAVPFWLILVLASSVCVPIAYFAKTKWGSKVSTLSPARRWMLSAAFIAVTAAVWGASLYISTFQRARTLESAPGRRQQGAPTLNGCGDRLRYRQDVDGSRFELDGGPCEAEIRDLGSAQDGIAYAHAFGVLFSKTGNLVSLPAVGFKVRAGAQAVRWVRAQLYRPDKNSADWCLTATSTNLSSPQAETILDKDLDWSTSRQDCATVDSGITSVKMRLDFDGMRLRVQSEFYKDAYSAVGKRANPQAIGHVSRSQYHLPIPNISEVTAGIGSAEKDQPRWHIWLMSELWRLRLIGESN